MFFRYPVSVIYPALDYEMVEILLFPNRIQQPGAILFALFSLIMNFNLISFLLQQSQHLLSSVKNEHYTQNLHLKTIVFLKY